MSPVMSVPKNCVVGVKIGRLTHRNPLLASRAARHLSCHQSILRGFPEPLVTSSAGNHLVT